MGENYRPWVKASNNQSKTENFVLVKPMQINLRPTKEYAPIKQIWKRIKYTTVY